MQKTDFKKEYKEHLRKIGWIIAIGNIIIITKILK